MRCVSKQSMYFIGISLNGNSNAGENFIDTSSNYQDEQSEHIIGEWMAKRGIRDNIVLAT